MLSCLCAVDLGKPRTLIPAAHAEPSCLPTFKRIYFHICIYIYISYVYVYICIFIYRYVCIHRLNFPAWLRSNGASLNEVSTVLKCWCTHMYLLNVESSKPTQDQQGVPSCLGAVNSGPGPAEQPRILIPGVTPARFLPFFSGSRLEHKSDPFLRHH